MSKKLLVIDGIDGIGKETQSKLLSQRLNLKGIKNFQISFPRYKSTSGLLIKEYLRGDMGSFEELNPYSISLLYSIDRYVSYINEMKKHINNNELIICDRYTTSNMMYQGIKFKSMEKLNEYIDWIEYTEFELMKIPKPDMIIFLKTDNININKNNINKRNINHEKDIHEENENILKDSNMIGIYLAEKFNWNIINCTDKNSNELLSINDINDKILDLVMNNDKLNL